MTSSPSSDPPTGKGAALKDAARATADKVKSSASDAATRVRETAGDIVDENREQAADRIERVGEALHDTAESTRAQDPNIAWLTEQASGRLQKAADYVRDRSWSDLRTDGVALARRHPVVFFGGMFVLGAVAGALVKAGVADATADESDAADSFDDDGADRTAYASVPPM